LIDGGDHPFCSNNIVFDITEVKDVVPAVINQSFFMEVYDGGLPPAHSGTYEWYSDGAPYSWLRLGQTFDIPETGATLKFWSYYEIEEDWDYGYVEVHDLAADEWYTLPGLRTISTLPEPQDNPNCPSEFEPAAYYDAGRWNGFTGFSNVMYQEEMDLTPFANHTIELFFTYWTDPFVLERGWCIDDIEILEIGFFDDVESSPNNWTYNGWYITIPVTTGTISSFSIEYYHSYIYNSLRAESASQDVPVNTTDQSYVFAELILTGVREVNVNVSEARQMIESNPNLVILDVRTLEEYESGHIENAVLIPVSELEERIDELDKERGTLVYCRSGGRSVTASEILVANGFESVYNMLGGITAWRNAGYWIEIIHTGDLIIDGTHTFIIENCTYIQTGNVYVSELGRLVVINSKLQINQHYFWECEFTVREYGTLEFEGVTLMSDHLFSVRCFDFSKVIAYELNMTMHGGGFWIYDNSAVYIVDSIITGISPSETSKVEVSNSTIDAIEIFFRRGDVVSINNLNPGYVEYLDLKETTSSNYHTSDLKLNKTFVKDWRLASYLDSQTVISESKIWIGIIVPPGVPTRLDNLGPGFYEHKHIGAITLNRTRLTWLDIHMEFANSSITITNSKANLYPGSNSRLFVIDSIIPWFQTGGPNFVGSICLDNATWTGGIMTSFSQFYIWGNVSFRDFANMELYSCNITRNYNIIATDTSDNPMENVKLSLFDQNDTVVWNGVTDSLGTTSFNLTFTDGNYTGTLRLEAVKGNYSAAMNVTFLSDTPVVLTIRYFADLNGDGTVNIMDIALVARAYGSRPGDPNWNPIADVAEPYGEINIVDIATVAKDYGKTV